MQDDTKRRMELADFLKTRRARLRPEQFGLPVLGRRRTPGLRRDEVAHLTGVGVSWYTWLEQGRDINVSEQVLESLAKIFQLGHEERRHLFVLARGMVPVSTEHTASISLPPGLQAILDALGSNPALLIDYHFNVVAWNQNAARVFGNFAVLSERERNRIWHLFVHPSSRQLYVNWESAAQHAVMQFRSAYDQHLGDDWFEQLLTELQQQSPIFCALWTQHNVQETCSFYQEKDLDHPQIGLLKLSSTTLVVPADPPFRIVTFTPRVQETKTKLEELEQARLHELVTISHTDVVW